MVEFDAREPSLARDESEVGMLSRTVACVSVEDLKDLIEQEGLWVNDEAAQSAWGALSGGELDLDELEAVAAGCEGVELPIAFPRFDSPGEAGPFR